jgi:hypothetical protein
MKQVLALAAATLGLVACGCASGPVEPNERLEAVYSTGSNLPKKVRAGQETGVSTYDAEAAQRARDQMPQTPRPGLGNSGG